MLKRHLGNARPPSGGVAPAPRSHRLATQGRAKQIDVPSDALNSQQRLGEIIRDARIAAGLTVRGLARAAGLSPGAITHIESANRPTPSFRAISNIAEVLGLSLDSLAGIDKGPSDPRRPLSDTDILLRTLANDAAAADEATRRLNLKLTSALQRRTQSGDR